MGATGTMVIQTICKGLTAMLSQKKQTLKKISLLWNIHEHRIIPQSTHLPKGQTSSLSDQELLQLYRTSGNNQYLGTLLQRYTFMLFGVCMKYLKNEEEARDAVQQVFSKVIIEIPRHQIEFFKSWIYMVARNHCLMMLRNRHQTIPAEWLDEMHQPAEDPLQQAAQEMEKEKLTNLMEEGLQQLQEPQKQCVDLFYLKKLSYQQVSEKTGLTLMQVKSNIQNGKRNIRIWMEKQLKRHVK
jgi:RNA polymerase sigma-70 factor (ECF subfamily)